MVFLLFLLGFSLRTGTESKRKREKRHRVTSHINLDKQNQNLSFRDNGSKKNKKTISDTEHKLIIV